MDPSLARLCRAHGIVTSVRDPGGSRQALDANVAVALLAAMGVRADSPAAIREALQDSQARRWRQRPRPGPGPSRRGRQSSSP